MKRKIIIDSFLFFNEKYLLISRIEYLKDVVDYFCIVESKFSFTGNEKKFSAQAVIQSYFGENFLRDRVEIFQNFDYLHASNFSDILAKYSGTHLEREIENNLRNLNQDKYVWLNDCFQRELLKHAIDQCVAKKSLDPNMLKIMVSDVDEIPSCNFVQNSLHQTYPISYAEMIQYRYNISIVDHLKWIGSVKFEYSSFEKFSTNELRFAPKRRYSEVKNYIIEEDGGWHFTSFGDEDDILKKMNSWGHQELNTLLNRAFVPFRLKYGLDVFGRDIVYTVSESSTLPQELKSVLCKYSLFQPRTPNLFHKLVHRAVWMIDRIIYRIFK